MSASVLLKHLSFWTLLAVWPSFSGAFVIVVRNESDSAVIPCIQQAGGKLEVLDRAGALPARGTPLPGEAPSPVGTMASGSDYEGVYERVYDNASPWLRSDLMGVKENDQRTISLLFVKEAKMVDCGNAVTFTEGTVLTAKDGFQCTRKSMAQVTEAKGYEKYYPQKTVCAAWVVAPIMDPDDQAPGCEEPGIPVVKRYYAQGPTPKDMTHGGTSDSDAKDILKVQVAKQKDTGQAEVAEVQLLGYQSNPCSTPFHKMRSAVGCANKADFRLYIDYCNPDTVLGLNPPPSTGSWSGVVKIREVKWNKERTVLDEFYLNVEIEKK